jgi:integrase
MCNCWALLTCLPREKIANLANTASAGDFRYRKQTAKIGKNCKNCVEKVQQVQHNSGRMKPTYYEPRGCWTVIVPPRFNGTDRRCRRFFRTKEDARRFVTEINQRGNVAAVELSENEKEVLAAIRASEHYSPAALAEAWRLFGNASANGSGKTVAELVELFYARQKAEGRSPLTLADDRCRLKPFAEKFRHLKASSITPAILRGYLESFPPGTSRRAIHKAIRKLWRWAYLLDHVASDPMAKITPMDSWATNNEVISPALFRRVLRVCAGLELPREGMEPTEKEKVWIASLSALLPYYALGGLAGIRCCEIVGTNESDPVLEWADIDFEAGLITIRDEVAKQTNSRNRKRYIPIEPALRALLEPITGKGPVFRLGRARFIELCRRRRNLMRVKLPENCLRNSFCSYGLTVKSSGDVARAMGDNETTIKRYYDARLKPAAGKAWFAVKLHD